MLLELECGGSSVQRQVGMMCRALVGGKLGMELRENLSVLVEGGTDFVCGEMFLLTQRLIA